MDEDLKIVLTSELEADEQASAQRISAQLPNIAKLINSKSTIKVGVALDSSNIKGETQKISQQIAQATKTHAVGVALNLNRSSIDKIHQELNNLKVNPDISHAMTEQLDRMGIQIDRITGRWQAVNGEEERMLNLTIQGTDQMQRTVTYLQTYDTETGNINTHLTNVTANLERQRNTQEQLARQAKADNESRVSYLTKQRAILADIQATYAGATSAKPITNDSHLTELNNVYSAINAQIQTMISSEGKLDSVQRSNLEAQIAGLKRMVKEYQNAEYVATKLRTKDIGAIKSDQLSSLEALEKRLEAAGTLTDTFKQKIDALKTTLNGISNKDHLVSFLNSFDQLNNDVSVFQERLRGVNNIYTQLISLDKQIASVQNQMVKLDPQSDKNKLVALQGQLVVLQNQRSALEGQLGPYADIVQYAKQATALEQSRLMNESQLVYTQMGLADKAREYDIAMQSVSTSVSDLETKMKQIANPTESLKQNMRLLRQTAAEYNLDMGDKEKINTYERLQGLIKSCSKEMSELMRIQRGDINDFKFTQGLEKAKADLADIRRTWSAFTKNTGLNAQFQQLEANLKRVKNQADLTKWIAQFSTFKSEVKAAGKNMQSLGDILKNNVGKVLQWVSATTLLFRAFRLLRSALSTIVDLDTAMVDLRKVTVATEEEYRKFYATANDTAKALGVTTEAVISQTAEWARLGYTMSEAAELAKNSAIFAAISPGMDITQATDGLVSALKAFDEIDVNDSLDGIISKVNDIGNKFAVSNKDIVEVMTRSSSAMKAANNTFEETVALATAAIEITRDSASVGNAMKTVSMRIRGYDEELEEYSDDVAMLTGDIADLTKVASNNNRGVSLFEAGDPDTYRSTYDILQDIAAIWDEMTDKNRAELLEVLFGKRQGQIGAAILSNFEQAQKAIETMENSAGSADREMEKIYQSLDYKLNKLQETWVGVAQNLFDTKLIGGVVSVLQTLSNLIDGLTEHLGFLGTVGLAGVIAGFFRFKTTISSINTSVVEAVNILKGVQFAESATSVMQYATTLSTLDPIQRELALSTLNLDAAQKEQIATMMTAITAAKQLTVARLEEMLNLPSGTIANEINAKSYDYMTAEMIEAALARGALTNEQLLSIPTTNAQTAANLRASAGFISLGASARAAGAAMMATPMGWVAGISLLLTLIPLVVSGINKVIVTAEEAYEAAEEHKKSFDEITAEVENLNSELETNKERLEELYRLSDNGTITLVEQEELEQLERTNAELETTIARKKELAAMDAEEANNGYVSSYNKTDFTSNQQDLLLIEQQTIYEQNAELIDKYNDMVNGATVEWADGELEKASELQNRLYEINNMLSSGWGTGNGTWINESVDYATHVEELVDAYNGLIDLQESGVSLSEAQKELMESTRAELVELAENLDEDFLSKYVGEDENTDEWNRLLDLINKTVYAAEYFSEKLTELPDDCYNQMEELGSKAELTADKVTELANVFPELNTWMNQSGYTAGDVAKHFNAMMAAENNAENATTAYGAKLDSLSAALSNFANVQSTIENISGSFQTLAELQAEVANGFSLSLDKALEFAAVYPEILNNAQVSADGQVVLNQEVVNSFIQGKKAELDAQIDAEITELESEKAVLQAKIEAAQAQLDLAKSVAEGEGGISKELAEYRINAGNAVAQALIDAGVDEATAFKLAAEAMAQNAEEFDRVAMEVCTDVNGNFNQAAYDLAQTMYKNLSNVKTDLASVAAQAHETAKAIAGIANGSVSGSSAVQSGSGGGTSSSGIKLNLTSGSFEGTEYTYTAKESGLEDFISQIELDITDYQNAVSQIDGQIAILSALKNTPLKEFEGGLGSSGGSGGSSSGGSSKEIEEYVADIDAYREAIERLRKAQEDRSNIETRIDESDNLKEKILLERQLIGAYEREQEALRDLNDQRSATITDGVASLRELGFAVKYNADANELWIENMEHLNDLTADSKGEYDTLQEATNALREETEDLIESLTDLNEENRDASSNWQELQSSMKDSREEILSLLDTIVEDASKAVDSIQNVYDTLHDAADEYAESGYITVDTLQEIIGLGVKYVAYLMDENGQLVINEERIRDVIEAKTQQLAIESSLSYIEALRIAKMEGNIETLNNLLYATEEATDATWGFVYASLAMAGLDQDQYKIALNNINAIRALADSAVQSIGKTAGSVADELEKMQSGLDDILKYVMDMLKQRINDQIDALEDMKDAYSEIIDMKKESLEATKNEADYEKKRANKLKEIAKLQARIDALSLDDSRESQAERAKLLEEMADLQEDLADEQADKALDATKDALDSMEEVYHKEKDNEIAILEDSISSYQKLYDMAIDYIQNHWDTLYSELIDWNTQYGNVLNSEITTAWDNALAAAQRYGSYVSALNNIGADIDAASGADKELNVTVGKTNYENKSSNEENIHAIIKRMYENGKRWNTASATERKQLADNSLQLGQQLAQYGVYAHRDSDGSWYMDGTNEKLFEKYKKYIYHTGGFAGMDGSLKDNEVMAKLKKGEPILTEPMWDTVTTMVDRMSKLSAAFNDIPGYVTATFLPELSKMGDGTTNNVYNNSSQPVEINIGDTIINGSASPETVNEHIKVNRDMVNQIARLLKIRI